MLLCKEGFEGVLCDMIPDGEQDQLVHDMEANLVTADKAKIVRSILIDGNYKTIVRG
jgi:hypothetical protein